MTEINHSNYEVLFLDYLEGRLSQQQLAELKLFIDSHPQLKDELGELELVRLSPDESVSFKEKETLKKSLIIPFGGISEQNYEEVFIAAAENDLSETEENNLQKFLMNNPMLQKEYDLIGQCRLQPDRNIVFAGKASLMKTIAIPFFPRLFYYGAAVAATLLLMIGLKFIFTPKTPGEREVLFSEIPVKDPANEASETRTLVQKPIINLTTNNNISRTNKIAIDTETDKVAKQKVQPDIEALAGNHRLRGMHSINTLATLPATIRIENNTTDPIINNTRHYFTNYFSDIATAQQMRYAESSDNDISATRLLAQGSAIVNEIFQPSGEERNLLPKQIDLWKIADVGINGFAKVTGADMEFRKQKNDEGKVTAFAFESQSMQFSHSLRRDK